MATDHVDLQGRPHQRLLDRQVGQSHLAFGVGAEVPERTLHPSFDLPYADNEVALFHACYVGTHTDRRIFISDTGNGRILSVRLGYHAEEKIALKDVPDQARP